MATYVQLADEGSVLGATSRLTALAQTYVDTVTTAIGDARAIREEHPEGGDKFGQQFAGAMADVTQNVATLFGLGNPALTGMFTSDANAATGF